MGNKRLNISRTANQELKQYRDFYNVNLLDPEGLTSPDDRTIGQFTKRYLKLMLQEKGLSYSRNSVGGVSTEGYFNQLVRRFEKYNHIYSFGIFLHEMENVDLAITHPR